MDQLKNFFTTRTALAMIVIGILLAGLVGGVYLTQRQTQLKSKAAGETLVLSPSVVSKIDTTISVPGEPGSVPKQQVISSDYQPVSAFVTSSGSWRVGYCTSGTSCSPSEGWFIAGTGSGNRTVSFTPSSGDTGQHTVALFDENGNLIDGASQVLTLQGSTASIEPTVPAPVTPTTPQAPPQIAGCSGSINPATDGTCAFNVGWSLEEKYGPNTCNVFVRDKDGDHRISNDNTCIGGTFIWRAGSRGINLVNGQTYELFVSNGDTSGNCYNQSKGKVTLNCPAAPAPPDSTTQCTPGQWDAGRCARCAGDGTWHTSGTDYGTTTDQFCTCAKTYATDFQTNSSYAACPGRDVVSTSSTCPSTSLENISNEILIAKCTLAEIAKLSNERLETFPMSILVQLPNSRLEQFTLGFLAKFSNERLQQLSLATLEKLPNSRLEQFTIEFLQKFSNDRLSTMRSEVLKQFPETRIRTFSCEIQIQLGYSCSDTTPVCLQVITRAKNPTTGECKDFPNSCIDPGWVVDNCTLSTTPTLPGTACYLLSEKPEDLAVASCTDPNALAKGIVHSYPTDPSTTAYSIVNKDPGLKTIYVRFISKTGEVADGFAQITLAPDPKVGAIACTQSATGTGTIVALAGTNFGPHTQQGAGGVTVNGTQAQIVTWDVTNPARNLIQATVPTRLEGTLDVNLKVDDGRSFTGGHCTIGTSSVQFSLTNQCSKPGEFSVDNVDAIIVQNVTGAKSLVQTKINVSKGVPQNFIPKLEANKNYSLILKGSKLLAKRVDFTSTADQGTVNLGNVQMLIGDIAPFSAPDGAINSFDNQEMIRQWSLLSNGGSAKTASLTEHGTTGIVNSLDWSCLKLGIGKQSDDLTLAAPATTTTTTTTANRAFPVRGKVYLDGNPNNVFDTAGHLSSGATVPGVTVKALYPATVQTPGQKLTTAQAAAATVLGTATTDANGYYSTNLIAPTGILNLVMWVDPGSTTGQGGQAAVGIGAFTDSVLQQFPMYMDIALKP